MKYLAHGDEYHSEVAIHTSSSSNDSLLVLLIIGVVALAIGIVIYYSSVTKSK